MGPVDIIAIFAIALVVGGAVFYIVRAKRRGEKCVGCPYAKKCGGNCGNHDKCNSKNNPRDKQK